MICIDKLYYLEFMDNDITHENYKYKTLKELDEISIFASKPFFELGINNKTEAEIANIKVVFSELDNVTNLFFYHRFFSTNAIIKDSYFKGLNCHIIDGSYLDKNLLMNCTFENCSNFLAREVTVLDSNITHCTKIQCDNATFSNCHFDDCYGLFLHANIGDDKSVLIENCEFTNVKCSTAKTFLFFSLYDDKKFNPAKISNCVFDNVELSQFLILSDVSKKTSDRPVVYVEKTLFKNCFTYNADGKIIQTNGTYDKLLKKGMPCTYIRVQDCNGLDKVIVNIKESNDDDFVSKLNSKQKEKYDTLQKYRMYLSDEEYQLNLEKILQE